MVGEPDEWCPQVSSMHHSSRPVGGWQPHEACSSWGRIFLLVCLELCWEASQQKMTLKASTISCAEGRGKQERGTAGREAAAAA